MIKFAIYISDIGFIKISYENNILISIKIISDNIKEFGEKTDFSDNVFSQIEEYLNGIRKSFNIPFKLIGTTFQKKVWNALCDIPYGETRSYKDIAISIDNKKAYRAVGMANNKNPIAIIVPCHRVIGINNNIVGYAAGVDIKEKLLAIEKNNK